jgi:hypothetical protein
MNELFDLSGIPLYNADLDTDERRAAEVTRSFIPPMRSAPL